MITNNDAGRAGNDEFKGYSTDTKPTVGVGVNSIFFELDTGLFYYYTGTEWLRVGWNEDA